MHIYVNICLGFRKIKLKTGKMRQKRQKQVNGLQQQIVAAATIAAAIGGMDLLVG